MKNMKIYFLWACSSHSVVFVQVLNNKARLQLGQLRGFGKDQKTLHHYAKEKSLIHICNK
jgi:hypothetical protein